MNNQLFTTLSIICICIFIGILVLLIKERRFNNIIHIILTTIFTIVTLIFNINLFSTMNYDLFQSHILISIILPFLILFVILSKQRFFTSFTFIINSFLSIFVINILRSLALRYIQLDPVLIDSLSFLLYPIIWCYVKYFYFDLQNEIDALMPNILPILFFYSVITTAEILIYSILADLLNQPVLRYEIFCAAVLSVYFVSFLIFNLLFRAYKSKLIDVSIEEILEKESHYIEDKILAYDESKNELRILKHDLKHVLVTAIQLLSNNNVEEANEYLQNYTKKIDNVVDTKKYSSNPIFDSIISYYATVCEKNEIKFTVQIDHFDSKLNISDLDFSLFISNCLENAVNATKKLNKNKEISFSLINNKNRLILCIRNTYNGKIKLDRDNRPISNIKNHGIGTTSIKWFADKYGWDLNYEINKNDFTISILFNNEVKQKEDL